MAHSKKSLENYLMTLRAFRDCRRNNTHRHLIYECCCLSFNPTTRALEKRLYFVPGFTLLPDDSGCIESIWIHMLSKKELQDYEEKCRKYGI